LIEHRGDHTISSPEVNDHGEVVYADRVYTDPDYSGGKPTVFSTTRGQLTFGPWAGQSTINNSGEVVYIAKSENNWPHLYSTINNQITDERSFPEPELMGEECLVELDLYSLGARAPDINDKGQVVFTHVLAEGPYDVIYSPYLNCSFIHSVQIYLATPTPFIDEILNFFDNCVDAETIVGYGPGKSARNRLGALGNMLETAADLIEVAAYEEACLQLEDAYKKCDGVDKPPDFVMGTADPDPVPELADMINSLMISLACE
jgi:hypothetical protein